MKVLGIPIILMAMLALGVVAGKYHAPAIEADVRDRCQSALPAGGAGWARLTVDGRDVTLAGAAPTAADRTRAAQALEAVRGVRVLVNQATIAPAAGDPIAACQRAVRKLLETESIQFRSASSELQPNTHDLLDRIVSVLAGCPEAAVQIGGHTDSEGDNKINRRLSEARANSVRAYLEQAGIDPDRMTSVGFGEEQPIASNATEAGRHRNRRIEFVLWRK